MNTENLGISGPGINGSNDPYMHPHLTHPHHLLPPPHSSSIYCSSSNPYAELFPQFSFHLMVQQIIQIYQQII